MKSSALWYALNWIGGAEGACGLSCAGERMCGGGYKIMANPPELNENDDNIYK